MTEEKSAYEGLQEAAGLLPRYKVLTAADALQPQPPIDWVIGDDGNGLISAGSLSFAYGVAGHKKTAAMVSLGVCTATGKDWLQFPTSKRPVLIIDEESGPRRLSRRLGEALRGELCTTDTPMHYVSLAGFLMDKPEDVQEVHNLILQTAAGLVIVDALTDIMSGDENSKQDTQPIMTELRRLAERTNAAIIVVHHANKSGGYRGSSAIAGAADLMLQVKSEEQDGNYIEFKTTKTRDIEPVTFGAIAHWNDGEFYLTPTDAKPKAPSKSATWLLEYLTSNGPTSTPDLMAAAEAAGVCKGATVQKNIQFMAAEKSIYRTNPNDAGRGTEAIYGIPTKPKI